DYYCSSYASSSNWVF
nr:immunoglobulin light chain junction region [Macaca mulatta]